MDYIPGSLLIASPHLSDPNFFRSVVLIVQHDSDGAFGLVLNRPTDGQLAQVWASLGEGQCPVDQPILCGGPIEGPLMAIHPQRDYSETEIMPGVYFATHKDHLEAVITQDKFPVRVFSGYSGWASGQLEGELEAGGWLIMDARPIHVFFKPIDDLWKSVSDEFGSDILRESLGITNMPDDPSMN